MGLFSSDTGKASIEYGKLNQDILNYWWKNNHDQIYARGEEAKGYLTEAGDLYKPLSALGEKTTGTYLDALGLNGADGNARATDAFQAGPGYQFQMDQGLQALERRAAAQGRLSSGNTSLDTINYASGLANQEYGNWRDSVGQLGTSLWSTGINGQANALGSLAANRTGISDRISSEGNSYISGLLGANNQIAEGKEAQAQAKDAMKGSLLGLGGKLLGSFTGGGGLGSLFGYGK